MVPSTTVLQFFYRAYREGSKKRKYSGSGSSLCEQTDCFKGRQCTQLTQITTLYKEGMQKSICEHTAHCYSCIGPHQVGLLLAQNRKEAAIDTNSPKLDNRRLGKHHLVGQVLVSALTVGW